MSFPTSYPGSFREWWINQVAYKAYQTNVISEALFEALTEMAFLGWTAHGDLIPSPSKVSFEKISGIISKKLGARENLINLQSDFIENLHADSLDLVELIMAFEDEFDIEINDTEAEKIKTVGDALKLLEKKVN